MGGSFGLLKQNLYLRGHSLYYYVSPTPGAALLCTPGPAALKASNGWLHSLHAGNGLLKEYVSPVYMVSFMARKKKNLLNPIYMAGAKVAHISKRNLLAWFFEQESKPFSMVSPVNPTVKKIDPLFIQRRKNAFANLDRIMELHERGTPGTQGKPGKRKKKPVPGSLPQGLQTLLCLKW